MSDVYSIAQEYWNEKKNFFQTMQCIICLNFISIRMMNGEWVVCAHNGQINTITCFQTLIFIDRRILIWEKIKCIQIANGFKITMKIDMLVI